MKNIKKYLDYAIEIRRKLHMHPEIGYALFETNKIICAELDKLNIHYVRDVGKSSIVATLSGVKQKCIIGIRADVDALAIEEKNTIQYKSLYNGKMHACGHDAHGAMLLAFFKYIVEEKIELNCTIKGIFQAAEEGPDSGGVRVCESGLVDDVDVFYALHVSPSHVTGQVALKYGEFNASCDDFEIKIIGQSVHAARPHEGIDPLMIANEIYIAIQNMKSRELNPLENSVISICTINGGNANNVIPDEVVLTGTVRTYDKDTRKKIEERIRSIVDGITKMHNGNYEIIYRAGCISLINTPSVCDFLKQVIIETAGSDNYIELVYPSMGVDDFAYYVDLKKGAMMYLGVKNDEKDCSYPLHNSRFNLDEDSLAIGIKIHLNILFKHMI